MIPRTKTAKKEKLKDIIDAVAAKESLLRPQPAAMPEDLEREAVAEEKVNTKTIQGPEGSPRTAERKKAAGSKARPLRSFWNGLCWGLGALTAAALLGLAAIYLSTKLLLLPYFAARAATLLSFILEILASLKI